MTQASKAVTFHKGAGLRLTQVSENNECTSSEPGGRARQPESCRRHCRLSRACRRENPRSIRLRGPEQQVHSDLPVRGRRRSWSRQPTWVLHNFSARAIQRTISPAILLVLTGSAIVSRAAAAQSRVLTPSHPPRLCGTQRPMDGCCGGGRRFQPTTACMQPSLHPGCLLRPWSQLDQCLGART